MDRNVSEPKLRQSDNVSGSFIDEISVGLEMPFSSPKSVPLAELLQSKDDIRQSTHNFLSHRFNILGSGWVHVQHGMICNGLEGNRYPSGSPVTPDEEGLWLAGRINDSNLRKARSIWKCISAYERSKDSHYVPIDWQLDFRSGYRWSESSWYRDIHPSPVYGSDIKVPWELGRMHHLIQLAWGYMLAKSGESGFAEADVYFREFKCQILDFVAQNPPRFGVQWACAMDVAIRVSNWLIAFDLFKVADAAFESDFENMLAQSVYEHGQHIVKNLEWGTRLRHNHYLSNIAGLLFVSSHLSETPESDAWLSFAAHELIHETVSQFHSEGSNFEGSVCYHCLSAEIAAYATGVLLGCSHSRKIQFDRLGPVETFRRMGGKAALIRLFRFPTPLDLREIDNVEEDKPGLSMFPRDFISRLARSSVFIDEVTKPSGCVVQIGDNDSGHFVNTQPVFRHMGCFSLYKNETAGVLQQNHLMHAGVVEAIKALFPDDIDTEVSTLQSGLNKFLIRMLASGRSVSNHLVPTFVTPVQVDTHEAFEGWIKRLQEDSALRCNINVFKIDKSSARDLPMTQALQLSAYDKFGMYIFRSKRLFLAIRCGSLGRNGQGGHDHDDQLSIELSIDGVDWVADPGTYVYSALPDRRNLYRSKKAHFVPESGTEVTTVDKKGLFDSPGHSGAKVCCFCTTGFVGTIGNQIYRIVRVDPYQIRVFDFVPGSGEVKHTPVRSPLTEVVPFSPGYGEIING